MSNDETAKKIASKYRLDETSGSPRAWLESDIASALRTANLPPSGHVTMADGRVVRVLETAIHIDGVTWGLKPGQTMLIVEAAESARGASQ